MLRRPVGVVERVWRRAVRLMCAAIEFTDAATGEPVADSPMSTLRSRTPRAPSVRTPSADVRSRARRARRVRHSRSAPTLGPVRTGERPRHDGAVHSRGVLTHPSHCRPARPDADAPRPNCSAHGARKALGFVAPLRSSGSPCKYPQRGSNVRTPFVALRCPRPARFGPRGKRPGRPSHASGPPRRAGDPSAAPRTRLGTGPPKP